MKKSKQVRNGQHSQHLSSTSVEKIARSVKGEFGIWYETTATME